MSHGSAGQPLNLPRVCRACLWTYALVSMCGALGASGPCRARLRRPGLSARGRQQMQAVVPTQLRAWGTVPTMAGNGGTAAQGLPPARRCRRRCRRSSGSGAPHADAGGGADAAQGLRPRAQMQAVVRLDGDASDAESVGELVWARMQSGLWWPAEVLDPHHLPRGRLLPPGAIAGARAPRLLALPRGPAAARCAAAACAATSRAACVNHATGARPAAARPALQWAAQTTPRWPACAQRWARRRRA